MSILILVFFELFVGVGNSVFPLNFNKNSPARLYSQFMLEAGNPKRFNSDTRGNRQPIAPICQRSVQWETS